MPNGLATGGSLDPVGLIWWEINRILWLIYGTKQEGGTGGFYLTKQTVLVLFAQVLQ